MTKESKNSKKKLTDNGPSGDNGPASCQPSLDVDPRIIAVVEFLARRAAERDFAQLIETTRRRDPERVEGTTP